MTGRKQEVGATRRLMEDHETEEGSRLMDSHKMEERSRTRGGRAPVQPEMKNKVVRCEPMQGQARLDESLVMVEDWGGRRPASEIMGRRKSWGGMFPTRCGLKLWISFQGF